jgi:membrane carboxypeptidase/penicillin-binding protein
VRAVRDGLGRSVHLRTRARVLVLPETAAWLTRGLLEDVVIFGISNPLRSQYGFTRPCGAKTGTTNDYRDAWLAGFTPQYAAVAWVGHDAPASLARPAAKVALPVWAGIMNALLAGFPATDFPARDDIVLAWIDPWSGGLARQDCPSPLRAPFRSGTQPTQACERDHSADWEAIGARALADSLAAAAADSAATADSLRAPGR